VQEKILGRAYVALIVAISLLALIGVLLFAWHVEEATPWAAMEAADWGVWVGGIGTVGTLVATIRLATESERRRRQEQLNLAMISAARFALWIPLVQSGMSTAQTFLAEYKIGTDPRPAFKRALLTVENAALWNSNDLLPLVHLPDHAATHISLISPKIEWVISSLRAASTSETLVFSEAPGAIEILQRNIQHVVDALEGPKEVCITFLEAHGFTGE
jgi:hypothetical protein